MEKEQEQADEEAGEKIRRLEKVKGKRPVIMKLIEVRWVKTVFSKILEYKMFGISILDDRTKMKQERRELIFDLQDKPKIAGIGAVIKRNKLFMDDKEIKPKDVNIMI